MGLLGSRKSFAMEIATKPLIMASEISGLEPLHGFIKQENRVVPVHFALAKKRANSRSSSSGRCQKPRPGRGRASAGNAGTSPPATSPPQKKTAAPATPQAAPPLTPAPAENPRSVLRFRDETKGIY